MSNNCATFKPNPAPIKTLSISNKMDKLFVRPRFLNDMHFDDSRPLVQSRSVRSLVLLWSHKSIKRVKECGSNWFESSGSVGLGPYAGIRWHGVSLLGFVVGFHPGAAFLGRKASDWQITFIMHFQIRHLQIRLSPNQHPPD